MFALTCVFAGDDAAAQSVTASEPGWEFSITPYAWLPSIDGHLRYTLPRGAGDATVARIGVDAPNLLEALNFAAMVAAEARHDRVSILTDFIYLDLGSTRSRVDSVEFLQESRTPISASLDVATKTSLHGTLWTLGGGYTLARGDWGHVDGIAGFRLFSLSARTTATISVEAATSRVTASSTDTGQLKRDATLFDGIIGFRGRIELGRDVFLPYAFDIGSGSSRITWQAMGGIAYQSGWAGVTLGYRHLQYELGRDDLIRDFSFSGPFVALNIQF
ncbi:hypothetical protein ACFOD4_19075 [Pseudoroseomonas globiformis]|uniref:Outer membrane protein beta-barrel domain-containing protein n=1 Tax=Teichococcus globiformis TaxID=2307229 RepID=A0ABV7G6U3_9PROT